MKQFQEHERRELIRRFAGLFVAVAKDMHELTRISDALRNDSEFAADLGSCLSNIARHLHAPSIEKSYDAPSAGRPAKTVTVDQIVNSLTKDGFTKRQIVEAIRRNNLLSLSPATLQSQSIREIVSRLLDPSLPEYRLEKFLTLIGFYNEPDAYLTGIDGRRK